MSSQKMHPYSLRFSDWPISIHNPYIFHRVLSDPYPDVLCSVEYQTKKLLVCCKMFVFFKAILLNNETWMLDFL